MTYKFTGKLIGLLCSECWEPLSYVVVRLYKVHDIGNLAAKAVANPKETFGILTEEQVEAKKPYLLAEAKADENGEFTFEFDKKIKYKGEAFELDVSCNTVPNMKPAGNRIFPTVHFTLTTLQPRWKELIDGGYIANWKYELPIRFWCLLRSFFHSWVICGKVVNCSANPPFPVPGVRVRAFDVDCFEDDFLGSAITDANGKFRIYYSSQDFRRQFMESVYDYEGSSGPDLYFKVETLTGIPILDESRYRGRDRDRENVGHCFCVKLCVRDPELPVFVPSFDRIGQFNIQTDIDENTGLTKHEVNQIAGPGFGFFHSLTLKGYCPAKSRYFWGQQMYYRFLYKIGENGAEIPVTGSLVDDLVVGVRINTNGSPHNQTVKIKRTQHSANLEEIVIVPDANGWIKVYNEINGGAFFDLMKLNTRMITPTYRMPEFNAGEDPGDNAVDGEDVRLIFETTIDPSDPTMTKRQELEARILVNNWEEVREIAIKQLSENEDNSCKPVSKALDILYTVDHQVLKAWSLKIITSAHLPEGTITDLISGNGPRGDSGQLPTIDTSKWPKCSYLLRLLSLRALTNGEIVDLENSSWVTFCI